MAAMRPKVRTRREWRGLLEGPAAVGGQIDAVDGAVLEQEEGGFGELAHGDQAAARGALGDRLEDARRVARPVGAVAGHAGGTPPVSPAGWGLPRTPGGWLPLPWPAAASTASVRTIPSTPPLTVET